MVGLGYPEVCFIYRTAGIDFYVNICKETRNVDVENISIVLIRIK
jgi:hypothetical protein